MSIANELAPNLTRAIIGAARRSRRARRSRMPRALLTLDKQVGALLARKKLELIGGPKKVFNRGNESSVTT